LPIESSLPVPPLTFFCPPFFCKTFSPSHAPHPPSLTLLTLLATPILAIDAPSPGKDWQEANRTGHFVICTQDDPATGTRKLTAITDLPQPPETAFKVVTNFAHYTQFMPYIKPRNGNEKG
jgi:hypothetical protein